MTVGRTRSEKNVVAGKLTCGTAFIQGRRRRRRHFETPEQVVYVSGGNRVGFVFVVCCTREGGRLGTIIAVAIDLVNGLEGGARVALVPGPEDL